MPRRAQRPGWSPGHFIDRRSLLKGTALGGAAAALAPVRGLAQEAGIEQNLPPNVPDWMMRQGDPILSPAYGVPSRYEESVVRRPTELTPTDTASWSFTPLQDLHGIITPNGLVFERHHAGVPHIDPEAHRLMVHGLVERPLIFSMDDLMRFPAVSRIYFLECSGNSLTEYANPQHSVQTSHGLISCCEWTGVPLATVLQEAGLNRDAAWILAEGADAAGMNRSIPIDKVLNDALLVYSQNGERLRPEQGYPLRLLLPGYEGNMQIKWLRRIEVGPEPWHTREETSKYTDLMPDGRAREFTYVMEAKSVITNPAPPHSIRGRGFREISGLAWSGYGRIAHVDVTVDGGRNWRRAELQDPILPQSLTRFRLAWEWNGEPTLLASRATDETGYVQPTRAQLIEARGQNYVYHYNAIQTWQIDENGEIGNAAA